MANNEYNLYTDKQNMTEAKYPKQYVDPEYWNPKCENFTIMDWDKWSSKNPTPPAIFDPPQRNDYSGIKSIPIWWWNRSCYFHPLAFLLHATPCFKPEMERISDGSLYSRLLTPNPNSDKIPQALRNHLLWTENNIAPETLISFNKWAWRSQSEEGRVIGVGNLQYDWTNDATCLGLGFAALLKTRFSTVQVSPDEKWILLGTVGKPDAESKVNYLYIYVVQEGDEFKDTNGNVLDHVQPGDLLRLSWGDGSDPYECDNSKLAYSYFPRKIATLNEETRKVDTNSMHQELLLQRATNKPGKLGETCCYCCSCFMNAQERFEFQVSNISDLQVFDCSPDPPSSQVLDRL